MKSLSILLAITNGATRNFVKEVLEKDVHIVCGECSDGDSAIDMARKLFPDVVILDAELKGIDCFNVAKILQTVNIPVVVITDEANERSLRRAESVYAFGYLVKPISEQNLLASIRIAHARWLDISTARSELAEMKSSLTQRKWVCRAKAILIDNGKISAQEAHRHLLREAMRQRMPLVDLAKKIIGSKSQGSSSH